jgi:hypothetical protein
MIAAVFTQFLNIDNLIIKPPGVGDMFNRLHIAADSELRVKLRRIHIAPTIV